MADARDRFGTTIQTGAVITYPVRDGSATIAVDAVVTTVGESSLTVVPVQRTYLTKTHPCSQRTCRVLRPARVAVLPHLTSRHGSSGWVILPLTDDEPND
jgi:hypothetical protein